MESQPKHRWYQFSLRTLLLVLTLLCLGPGGYVAYHRDKLARDQAAAEAIERTGGRVEIEFSWNPSSRPAVVRWVLGTDRFAHVGTIHLENFRGDIRVTDGDLVHLRRFPNLKRLYIHNVQVTDAGIVHLASLTKIESLILSRVEVTDAGLTHFAGMSKLQLLNLDHTKVKGPGLIHLAGLRNLSDLTLRDTPAESRDVEQLQRSLPNLKIMR